MATYTITGHPLNPHDLATTPGAAIDPNILAALRNNGIGKTVTVTLAGPDDTKVKAHRCLT